MIKYYARKIMFSLFSMLGLFVLIALLAWSNPVGEGVKNGVDICLYTLIPSLFVFMSVSSFFMKIGVLRHILYPFSWICSKLFKVDIKLGPLLFMSLIGGYPVGAKLLSELVQKDRLKRSEANRLLCFCVNAGPSFLIGAVALPMFHSINLGFALFGFNVISFFIIGFLTGIGKEQIKVSSIEEKQDIAANLVDSVYSSIKAMGVICGFVLLFSALIGLLQYSNILAMISSIPSMLFGDKIGEALITGLLEIVNGIQACTYVSGSSSFILVAIITAFGGLSVHSQIKAIIIPSRLSMKPFYFWRVVNMAICGLCSYFYLYFSSQSITTFVDLNGKEGKLYSFTPIASIFLIILAVMLLFNIKNSAKINKVDSKKGTV